MQAESPSSPRIIFLDASAFKESSCLKKLEYIILEGVRSKQRSLAAEYGSAFHNFVATLKKNDLSFPIAIASASNYYLDHTDSSDSEDWRSLPHLISTCKKYYDEIIKDGDTFKSLSPLIIEERFALPWKRTKDGSHELYLAGTVDEIGVFENRYCIKDIKVTSSFDKQSFLENFNLSSQLMFYKYVLENFSKLCISESKLSFKDKPLTTMIDGIFIAQSKSSQFQRSEPIDFPDDIMKSFEDSLENKGNEIIKLLEAGDIFTKNFTLCDTFKYDNSRVGTCPYFKLCSTSKENDKGSYDYILEKNYTIKEYNPMTHGD